MGSATFALTIGECSAQCHHRHSWNIPSVGERFCSISAKYIKSTAHTFGHFSFPRSATLYLPATPKGLQLPMADNKSTRCRTGHHSVGTVTICSQTEQVQSYFLYISFTYISIIPWNHSAIALKCRT